ncbi:hypothetical protein FLW53_29505 [Microbispora sp. SCL1-1]|uniref:hypothetical protein n=1 Tax=unclassified Microbispora TaxID=2614687 RepID=UPI00115B300A|nr:MULTISPECIES: hypothetical protein [unclassified Microbispora]NJP28259.1 hypothetical protein [Microbispora sp. CL1-1]TQS09266.1 hypothetical protein FLW53_29505 [Microbispora sp. SCL1-1]
MSSSPDIEQTSNLFPWLAHDLDVRTVPPADLPGAIDERTDAVVFSLAEPSGAPRPGGHGAGAGRRRHGGRGGREGGR